MKNSSKPAQDSKIENSAIAQNSEQAIELIEKSEKIEKLTPLQIRLKEIEKERKELLELSKNEKKEEKERKASEKKLADEKNLKEKEEADAIAKKEKEDAEKLIEVAEIEFAEIEKNYLSIKSIFDAKQKEIKELRLKLNPKKSHLKSEKSDSNKESKPGVISSIAKLIEESGPDGISKEEILSNLEILFPEKDSDSMLSTIKVQVPYRINKERFEIAKTADNRWFKK